MGVCKVFAEGGLLSGCLSILSFLSIFLASLLTLCGKALMLMSITSSPDYVTIISLYLSLTLPGLVTGVYFIWHDGLFKTFLRHPSLLHLPMFTFFSFESNAQKCCAKKYNVQSEVEIMFSVKATLFNIFFSVLGSVAIAFIIPHFAHKLPVELCEEELSPLECSFMLLSACLVTIGPGILVTITFLCFFSCCLKCFCSCCPSLEFGVYRPSAPRKVFVMDQSSKEVKEVEEFALA